MKCKSEIVLQSFKAAKKFRTGEILQHCDIYNITVPESSFAFNWEKVEESKGSIYVHIRMMEKEWGSEWAVPLAASLDYWITNSLSALLDLVFFPQWHSFS